MKTMENTSEKLLEVLDVMKESIKLNCPEDIKKIEDINKIKDYINQMEER
jgi:hypothetical protein